MLTSDMPQKPRKPVARRPTVYPVHFTLWLDEELRDKLALLAEPAQSNMCEVLRLFIRHSDIQDVVKLIKLELRSQLEREDR